MYKSFLLMVVAAVLLGTQTAEAQGVNTIEAKYDRYRKNDLQEKLFVHTDKNFYLAGERIWFKIYDVSGATNAPVDFSQVAYIELIDRNQQPVYQTKISLAGNGEGTIKIPLSIPTGNYLLRAYTAWMKNFSPDFFYKKTITIVNAAEPGGGATLPDEKRYDIQFLPEGGNLVDGIESEVGFRAVDQSGRGIDFKGVLLNEDNDTLLSFRPFKFGMGHFYFTPRSSNNYHAVLTLSNDSVITTALPKVYEKGYVMHLERNDQTVKMTVNTNLLDRGKAYLVIQTRGELKVREEMIFHQGKATVNIALSALDDGISQFTVFDEALHPVCERLFFKTLTRKLQINIKTDKATYHQREKINLSIETKDESDHPAPANMSVAVYRLDSLQGIGQDNILNYLWLTSELSGHIENPVYYFSNTRTSEEALENLMLTQGWRRFSWDNVMQNKLPDIAYAPETGDPIMTGRVKDESDKPAAGILAYLGILGKYDHVSGSVSNDQGFVYFRPKNFYGSHEIVAETNGQSKDSIYHVEIINPFTNKENRDNVPELLFAGGNRDLLEQHYLWEQVERAYHGADLDSLSTFNADSTAFYGKPYQVYYLDDYTRYTTMEEVLREYVTEVAVRKRAGRSHFQVMNALFNYDKTASAMLFQDDPLVLLDGIPVFNLDSVMALDPLKIEKLQVVAGRYFWGPVVADGIVSFTTYKGNMAGLRLNAHTLAIDYNGLQQRRQFYKPGYDLDQQSLMRIPDFRNVLYWNSILKSGKKGTASGTFYSSDIVGRYVIVINGITKDGRAGYGTGYFEVTGP